MTDYERIQKLTAALVLAATELDELSQQGETVFRARLDAIQSVLSEEEYLRVHNPSQPKMPDWPEAEHLLGI